MLSLRSYSPMFSKSDSGQQQSIIDYINRLEDDNTLLEEKIATARLQIKQMQQQESQENAKLTSLQKTLDRLNKEAEYTEITGSGVIITINDNEKGAALAQKNTATYNAEDYIIHDKNLLYLTRSLSKVAQGIAINDQRLIDTSTIRCVGTVIMVNSARMAPPYEIRIIGDPDRLEEAILESDEYQTLKNKDMPLKLLKEQSLTLPAYSGSATTTYAQMAD